MIPFDVLRRSESARPELASAHVRIWEDGAWGFWSHGDLVTANSSHAKVFAFREAWKLAVNHPRPKDLLFDVVS
jgi:hypothetical protein